MGQMAPKTFGQTMGQARVDRARLAATTEADIERQAREDGTDGITDLSRVYPAPGTLRRHLKLTQPAMADLIGVPLGTWRNWEQGRVSLDPAVQTLLRIMWREFKAFRRTMAAA